MSKAPKSTKSQIAYEKIRRILISHKLEEQKQFSIRKLASQLDMSVVPVTEAIRRLEQEGIINVSPQRGIYRKELTEKKMKEVTVIREGLEVQAARILAQNGDEKTFEKLIDGAHKLQEFLKAGKKEQASYQDFKLHKQLVKAAGIGILMTYYDQLVTMCMACNSGAGPWLKHELEGMGNHVKLMERIASRDPRQADRAMRIHLRSYASTPESSEMAVTSG